LAVSLTQASALELSLIKKAAFEETFERFPSPYAVLQQFKRIVPKDSDAYSHQECNRLDKMSAPVLGVNDPLQLAPLEQTPGELFYQYYIDCVHKIVKGGFSYGPDLTLNSKQVLSGADIAGLLTVYKQQCEVFGYECNWEKDEFHRMVWIGVGWSTLDATTKYLLMDAWVNWLIGPQQILQAKGYIGENNVFGAELADIRAFNLFLIAHADTIKTGKDGAVAMVKDIYAEMAILLRLGPALKN
jgi:hypothetical protein